MPGDLTIVLTLALVMTYAVEFVRALPWPASWLVVRPLSCNVCLVGWFTIALMAVQGWLVLRYGMLRTVAAAGLALLLLEGLRWLRVSANFASPPSVA